MSGDSSETATAGVAPPGLSVAITQPTFLPWLGWFDLIDQVDLAIELDDVAFAKRSWQQRNRIVTAQGLAFLTVPVRSSGRYGQRIVDTELADGEFVGTMLRTITANYARAPHYCRYFPGFSEALRAHAASGRLVELNCGMIDWIARQLGIGTPRIRSSSLEVQGKRGEALARLCAHVGAGRYLSPVGAAEYLAEDIAEFTGRGIVVELQGYEHPSYRQCSTPFTAYASALDLLFNEGEAALGILRSGRRAANALPTA